MIEARLPMPAAPAPRAAGGPARFGLLYGANAVLQGRRIDRRLASVPALTATFLSKLSIPPFGAAGLSLSVPLLCLTGFFGVVTGRMVFHRGRTIAYCLLVAALWAVQIVRTQPFSVPSLLLFTLLHFPYVLELARPPDYARVIRLFQTIAMTIAVLGLLQYAVQFVFNPAIAFPIENYFPPAFKVDAFNAQGSLEYGSQVYRTNGVFMLEPSFFSQLMAIGIVVELLTRLRVAVILLMLAAIVVSYSGTGLMLLIVVIPCILVLQRRWSVLIVVGALIAVAVAVVVFSDSPYARLFARRATEFNATRSSGFARFVGGFYMFEQFLWPDPMRALFGLGAGSLQGWANKANYLSGGNVLFKMVFEFGLVGGIAYFSFLYYCLTRSAAPPLLRLAIAITYYLGGIYIPFAHGLAMGLLIWPAPRHAPVAGDRV